MEVERSSQTKKCTNTKVDHVPKALSPYKHPVKYQYTYIDIHVPYPGLVVFVWPVRVEMADGRLHSPHVQGVVVL